ncbi:MAG: alpha/beta hydrolase, partial [Gemmatimonadaceae bacterium]|nr:alpha/beta hydrolase [Gemmatimonadaceae bacterium]
DMQVTVADAESLAKAQPKAKLAIIDGMNHVLKMVPVDQAAQMRSYGDPTLPVAPALVDAIAGHIRAIGG